MQNLKEKMTIKGIETANNFCLCNKMATDKKMRIEMSANMF